MQISFNFSKESQSARFPGVTPVAVMIKPEGSCRWNCIYCPAAGKAAKSYTGEEPAALRARANNFDSAMQVKDRLNQFTIGGHPTSKCEIIVMGGTFLQMDENYKQNFIKGIYDALNNDSENKKGARNPKLFPNQRRETKLRNTGVSDLRLKPARTYAEKRKLKKCLNTEQHVWNWEYSTQAMKFTGW